MNNTIDRADINEINITLARKSFPMSDNPTWIFTVGNKDVTLMDRLEDKDQASLILALECIKAHVIRLLCRDALKADVIKEIENQAKFEPQQDL